MGGGGCGLKPKGIAWLAQPQEEQLHCDWPELQLCLVLVGAFGEALGAGTLLLCVQVGLLVITNGVKVERAVVTACSK